MNEGHEEPETSKSGAFTDYQLLERTPPIRPIWRFLIAAVYVFGANWLALFLAYQFGERHPLACDALYRILGCVILLAGFHFMLMTFDEVDDHRLAAMGLPLDRRAVRQTLQGLAIGAGLIIFCVLVLAIIGNLTFHAEWSWHSIAQVLEVLVLLIFGAMLEELSFRGYAFQRLRQSLGTPMAMVALSVLFGVVHLGNPSAGGLVSWGFFVTVGVGILFAVAYIRTGSLWMPFGIHFGWNFFLGFVFGLPVSGIRDFNVVVRSMAVGSKALTGGSYGIEASATGAAAVVLGFVPVFWLTRKCNSSSPVSILSIQNSSEGKSV